MHKVVTAVMNGAWGCVGRASPLAIEEAPATDASRDREHVGRFDRGNPTASIPRKREDRMPIAAHELAALPPHWHWRRGIDEAWEAHSSCGGVIVQEVQDRSWDPTDGRLRIIVDTTVPAAGGEALFDVNGHPMIPSCVLLAVARANDHEGIL